MMRCRRRCFFTLSSVAIAGMAVAADDVGTNWTLEVAAVNYQTVASLYQDSLDPIQDEYATKEINPQLAFRCKPSESDEVSISINWRRFISSFNTEVGFKVDDKELLLLNWGVDRSNKITAPRSGGRDPELLEYLQGGTELRVEVIPYAESLITVTYDISGIDAALHALKERCES